MYQLRSSLSVERKQQLDAQVVLLGAKTTLEADDTKLVDQLKTKLGDGGTHQLLQILLGPNSAETGNDGEKLKTLELELGMHKTKQLLRLKSFVDANKVHVLVLLDELCENLFNIDFFN